MTTPATVSINTVPETIELGDVAAQEPEENELGTVSLTQNAEPPPQQIEGESDVELPQRRRGGRFDYLSTQEQAYVPWHLCFKLTIVVVLTLTIVVLIAERIVDSSATVSFELAESDRKEALKREIGVIARNTHSIKAEMMKTGGNEKNHVNHQKQIKWDVWNCGKTETNPKYPSDAEIVVWGTGYRSGNTLSSKSVFEFSNSQSRIVWGAFGNKNYAGFSAGIHEIGCYAYGTTHHSWEGSLVLPFDTWLYTRIVVSRESCVVVTSLHNFDDHGGSAIQSKTKQLSDSDSKIQADRLLVNFGDNYGSTGCNVAIQHASTNATVGLYHQWQESELVRLSFSNSSELEGFKIPTQSTISNDNGHLTLKLNGLRGIFQRPLQYLLSLSHVYDSHLYHHWIEVRFNMKVVVAKSRHVRFRINGIDKISVGDAPTSSSNNCWKSYSVVYPLPSISLITLEWVYYGDYYGHANTGELSLDNLNVSLFSVVPAPSHHPTICPPGSYVVYVLNETKCIVCSPGFYCEGNTTAPHQCPAGTYNPFLNQSSCLKCPVGKSCLDRTKAIDCKPGTASRGGQENCTSCPPHTYSSWNGSAYCLECFPGTWNNETGQTKCSDCPRGTDSDPFAGIPCHTCYGGVYAHIASSPKPRIESLQPLQLQRPAGLIDWSGRNTVSINEAGVLVMGMPGNMKEKGEAYIFRWNGVRWIQVQRLLPSDSGFSGCGGGQFGHSVSINNANTIVIGAPHCGRTFVYIPDSAENQWIEAQQLVPKHWIRQFQWFGKSVSINSADDIVVGAPYCGNCDVYPSAVVVFERSSMTGQWQQAYEFIGKKRQDYWVGLIVSIDDTRTILASGNDQLIIPQSSSVSIVVSRYFLTLFQYDSATFQWKEATRFNYSSSDYVWSAGMNRNQTIVVGLSPLGVLSGRVHIYTKKSVKSDTWILTQTLENANPNPGVSTCGMFGFAVSINDAGTIIVGVPGSWGAVLIFVKCNGRNEWVQVQQVKQTTYTNSTKASYGFGSGITLNDRGQIAIAPGRVSDEEKGVGYVGQLSLVNKSQQSLCQQEVSPSPKPSTECVPSKASNLTDNVYPHVGSIPIEGRMAWAWFAVPALLLSVVLGWRYRRRLGVVGDRIGEFWRGSRKYKHVGGGELSQSIELQELHFEESEYEDIEPSHMILSQLARPKNEL